MLLDYITNSAFIEYSVDIVFDCGNKNAIYFNEVFYLFQINFQIQKLIVLQVWVTQLLIILL